MIKIGEGLIWPDNRPIKVKYDGIRIPTFRMDYEKCHVQFDYRVCHICNGTGYLKYINSSLIKSCNTCEGTGVILFVKDGEID